MESASNDIEILNKNHSYNDMLARALVQLMPDEERPHVMVWLDKLQSIKGDVPTLIARNEYTWLLLLAIQSGKLTEPFDRFPPNESSLPPISNIMSPNLYREMLTSSDQNFSWIDDLILGEANTAADDNRIPSTSIPPRKFLDRQPQPINGITCYFSVFSNST